MKDTALITGASSGIGEEFARIHAARGGDLVLVARRQNHLEALAEELRQAHGVAVLVIACDLTDAAAPAHVLKTTREAGIEITTLINNAGFGGRALFHEQDLERQLKMIDLNVRALTELTHLFVQDMVARKAGRILNVASTAGLIPGPLQAVYFASKAYVVSFSQALTEELSDTGVTVTALCPGGVNTAFFDKADMRTLAMVKEAASADEVARFGYEAMEKGKLLVINDARLRFMLNWLTPITPRKLLLKISRRFMEKTS